MIGRAIYSSLFQARELPPWWGRFVDNHPVVPNLIAIAGLVWITVALTHFSGTTARQERGALVQTVENVSRSGTVASEVLHLRELYRSWFPEEVRAIASQLYYNPALYLVIPFLLLLEFLFPVNPSQPLIGKGFLQDTIWFVALAPVRVLIFFPIGAFIERLVQANHELLQVDSAAAWPIWVRIIAALLLGEFVFWSNHFIRHKIRVLWLFHAVHHSQKEMNVFTDDRLHIVDSFIESTLAFIPFFLLRLPNIYAVAAVALYMPIHTRFIHANIRMNLGWLGWIVTSPQFHRVHHSAAPEHLDKNFGGHFSLFDNLFGTACRDTSVYPETGIDDARFPSEGNVKWSRLPGNWLKQTVYPFTQLFEDEQPLRRMRSFIAGARHARRELPQPQILVNTEPGARD